MRTPTPSSPLWRTWLKTCQQPSNRIVLIDAARNLPFTAKALTERAAEYAATLSSHRPGTRIAFRLPNGPDWVALFLALQRCGHTAIPLDGALPLDGCLETARSARAQLLYFDGQFHPLPASRRTPGGVCVKVTSGSEGIPKFVECRAEHLLADGRHIIKTMQIRPADRNLAVIPLGHSYGLGNLVLPLLLQGTALVTASHYVPRQLAEWIERHRVTVLPLVPALFRVLAALPPGPNLPSLRTAISAGAILSPAIAQGFFQRYQIKIHNFYGSSETGGICYDRTGQASLAGASVGKPLTGVSVTIARSRITVSSPAVATRTGRWKLGDLAEWNAKGELVLLGRLGQEANIGGKKVHPREVEQALRSLPGITDAAVWLSQSHGRDLLAAAVETTLSQTDLERALALRLPAWKAPKKYFLATELPRNARGKLDLALIRQKAVS
jgi:acyl-CoA synthetase (AMP-forming)/AMP-acid ligase II